MTVLVTGANGFIGVALCERLDRMALSVRVTYRRNQQRQIRSDAFEVGEINSLTDWRLALRGVQQVVHLAGRVHIMQDSSSDRLDNFRRVNVEGAAKLARQAADQGVRRLVFLSSVKVNGESTFTGQPFTVSDTPAPVDPYGISKYEAEQVLRCIAAKTGMEIVIIRAPLVYGPNVKANFGSMMRWLARGVPLPFAGVTENRRSLVALDNLVDLIEICLKHPAAANQTFLVSDDEDLSTASLLRRIGDAQGTPARLFYAPTTSLKLGAAILGKHGLYQRLCGSLQVDISKTRQILDWIPSVSVDEGLRRTCRRTDV